VKFRNSKKQGDWGLGSAIAWFTAQGYTVALPITDSQHYDLIVDIEGRLMQNLTLGNDPAACL
jgi:hypothetical protein